MQNQFDDFIKKVFQKKKNNSLEFFDKKAAEHFVEDLYRIVFLPVSIDSQKHLEQDFKALQQLLSDVLLNISQDQKSTEKNVQLFFNALPELYEKLNLDAEAILEFDPATESLEEILLSYPGYFATYVYRISHQLWKQGIKILPRVLSEYAHSKTGIDIHPGAEIGDYFFIDHGTGIVIGETSIIGNHVKIYQGVTLGALNVSKQNAKQKRHPNIEDHVIIYSGATILGGNTTIGRESIIGGNVWITQNVPPYSLVYHKSEIKIKDNSNLPESLNFVI